MIPAIDLDGARVYLGDCREVLRGLADNSVDSIVTDPPYELGFMGKKWDSSGIAYDVDVWEQCLRVLKPGGHLLAFGGSRTWHRLAVAIEDAGYEVRDSIAWLYGSGFPKSLDVSKAIDKRLGAEREVVGDYEIGGMSPDRETFGANDRSGGKGMGFRPGTVKITAPSSSEAKAWQGWGTALKPAFEPVVVGRKPLVGTVAENVLLWGVGGLNIDGSRIGSGEKIPGGGGLKAFEGRHEGWVRPSHKNANAVEPHTQGRWPANVILDEVSAGLLDEQSGVSVSKVARRGLQTSGQAGGLAGENPNYNPLTDTVRGHEDSGGASRFFYQAKASKRDRNEGLEELQQKQTVGGGGGIGDYLDDVNSASGKYGSEKAPAKNFHPTVKPTQLMRYLIKLVTPAGGTVLDPFTGSGSTGKAALLDGFQFVGAELTEEYLPIIEGRLRWASEQVEDEDVTLF